MIKFLLCDDNAYTLNITSNMLESIFMKYNFEATIIYKATSDTELLTYIKSYPVDVFILDINLRSKLTGIDIAKKIRENNKNSYIIFITGHGEYNELAFKCKTFDFLRKPITKSILEETILRLFDDITGITINKKYIRVDNKHTLIDENEIRYIERDGMKVILHTNFENIEIYSSFKKLLEQLPNNFVRCHKSYIVNINNITKIKPSSNLIYFKDNSNCDIGPKYKENFLKEVNLYV